MFVFSLRFSDFVRFFKWVFKRGVVRGGKDAGLDAKPEEAAKSGTLKEGALEGRVFNCLDDADVRRIESYFKSKVEILSQVSMPPLMSFDGDYNALSDTEKKEVDKKCKELTKMGRPNDMHVILAKDVGKIDFRSENVILPIKIIDYASLLVLCDKAKDSGKDYPVLVTSNVLVCCREENSVVLHKRDDSVVTDGGKLHFFGGGYMPDSEGARAVDLSGFKKTVKREVEEASGLEVEIGDDTPILLVRDDSCKREKGIRFLQVNYIYCCISAKDYLNVNRYFDDNKKRKTKYNYTWEGEPFPCELIRLRKIILDDDFKDSDFAMSGKAHILAWMRLGCPGINDVGSKSESAGKAQKLFYDVMEKGGVR